MIARMPALSLLFALALAAVSRPAAAHQVWLEPAKDGTRLYFGEFGDNLHEVSPGYLDKLSRPTATLLAASGEKTVAVSKQRDAFVIAGRPGKAEALIVVDAEYPVSESKEGDKAIRSVWTPAARFAGSLGAQAPKLTLDVVPTETRGEFQVFFRGKPLPAAELTLTAVSGWARSETSDSSGKVRFTLPWKGTYALLVRHRDDTSGSRPGAKGTETFERSSFGTTLTFVTTEGLISPPAPPAAAPNTPK
ncbi:MAG: hypothetical protein RL685_7067 [Pseudomonadota bacterium]|jgi:uncharacterized GH25 family protein